MNKLSFLARRNFAFLEIQFGGQSSFGSKEFKSQLDELILLQLIDLATFVLCIKYKFSKRVLGLAGVWRVKPTLRARIRIGDGSYPFGSFGQDFWITTTRSKFKVRATRTRESSSSLGR